MGQGSASDRGTAGTQGLLRRRRRPDDREAARGPGTARQRIAALPLLSHGACLKRDCQVRQPTASRIGGAEAQLAKKRQPSRVNMFTMGRKGPMPAASEET